MSDGALTAIDTHSHFLPPSFVGPAERGESWNGIQFGRSERGKVTSSVGGKAPLELPWPMPIETFESRRKSMTERRVARHVLSMTPTMYWHGLTAEQGRAIALAVNDDLARIVLDTPDRFSGLGYLPLQDPEASVGELERCMRLGLKGVMVCSNVNGLDWDEPALFPILEAAQATGAIVYFHPSAGRANAWLNKYHLKNLIGNPLETTVTLASLIFGKVYDRLPELKTCFSHAGGYGVLGIGRFDHGYEVRPEATGIAHLPSDYVRRIWVDTITHSERSLRYIVDTVGIDRVVLGSDYPADMGEPRPVDFIESCASLTAEEKRAILTGNAETLFGLKG